MTPAKAQRNLSEILNRTRKPQTQEPGLPYYAILPVIEKKSAPVKPRRDWYPLALILIAVGLVSGLIWGNIHFWANVR